ncbi:MAG: methyltransferase domain-containing protein [Ruminococcaceae bacterium]|nr:methyltransferase domain-containing protein [Oscillospiraceae bacterium]
MVTENYADEEIYEKSPINERVILTERKNGFRMGTDSVLLSKFAGILPHEKGMDLGTGSGVIPLLLLSENKGKEIKGIEIQESLHKLALHNAKENGFEDKFTPILGDIRNISSFCERETMDFVTLNPPYFKNGSGKQSESLEKLTARHEMNGVIDDFCAAASYCLKYGGKFYAVFRADRLTELLYAMKENRIEPKHIELIYKKEKVETVLVQGTKGAKAGLKITVKETSLVQSMRNS